LLASNSVLTGHYSAHKEDNVKLGVKLLIVLVVTVMIGAGAVQGQTLDEYIKKAKDFQASGDLPQAVKTMTEATEKFPDNPAAYSYLGLYTGIQAGQTKDFMEAGRLIGKSFEILDKAVSLGADNPIPRYHRGVLGVNIPEFLGKLDPGVSDLEIFIKMSEESPGKVKTDMLISGYYYLAQGYQKQKETQKAILTLKKIIKLAPESELAKHAEKNIAEFSKITQTQKTREKKPDSTQVTGLKQKVENDPDNPALLLELGKAYIDDKDFESAREILKKAIKLDAKNIEAYKLLVSVLSELAGTGYDERIYENTDLRSNLAFEIMEVLDKACAVSPEDIELRLLRGIIGVEMPFFVEKLEQAIVDLNWILKSNAPDSAKAEALYRLGEAYRKKAMSFWIKVVTKYPESKAARDVFDGLRTSIKRLDLSKYRTPILTIDFVLGFRDELAPQTAVWIETREGAFVKTIYVSGFSGHAKEQQVNLPTWSKSSKFADVDAVTRASINLGHHIYVWDLNDASGNRVKPGEYIIKVEVAYWPSMEYQLVSAALKLGKNQERAVTEEGNLIPYLEVKYYPSIND
jgi:tetratricopeptide (TPR) repeat protein